MFIKTYCSSTYRILKIFAVRELLCNRQNYF